MLCFVTTFVQNKIPSSERSMWPTSKLILSRGHLPSPLQGVKILDIRLPNSSRNAYRKSSKEMACWLAKGLPLAVRRYGFPFLGRLDYPVGESAIQRTCVLESTVCAL